MGGRAVIIHPLEPKVLVPLKPEILNTQASCVILLVSQIHRKERSNGSYDSPAHNPVWRDHIEWASGRARRKRSQSRNPVYVCSGSPSHHSLRLTVNPEDWTRWTNWTIVSWIFFFFF